MRVATRSRNARSWVTTMAAGCFARRSLEHDDAVDIEVVGRLVEEEEIGLERERRRERGALSLAARHGGGSKVRLQAEPMEELDDLVFRRDGFEVGRCRLLLDQRHAQAVAPAELAVVEGDLAGDHPEER